MSLIKRVELNLAGRLVLPVPALSLSLSLSLSLLLADRVPGGALRSSDTTTFDVVHAPINK